FQRPMNEYATIATSTSRPLPRVDREIAIGHLQDDERHGGGIVVGGVAFPVALRLLLGDKLLANGGIPLGPEIAAGEEHRLDGVVVAVVVVALHLHFLPQGGIESG